MFPGCREGHGFTVVGGWLIARDKDLPAGSIAIGVVLVRGVIAQRAFDRAVAGLRIVGNTNAARHVQVNDGAGQANPDIACIVIQLRQVRCVAAP